MVKLAQLDMTMNTMQYQMKTLSETLTNPTITDSKFYYCNCRSNFTHGIKTFSENIIDHKEGACYNKQLGVSEKGCE